MTYFPDLSEYSYFDNADTEFLNVGWLSQDHDFPVGAVPEDFLPALVALARKPKHLTRGFHVCDLCPRLTADEFRQRWREISTFESTDGNVQIGNGEIHICGVSGTVYAAPTMILHYISEHRYLPPAVFVQGVLARG